MPGVLIVTGGSRGIGAATARIGAREGYAVCVNYAKAKNAALSVVRAIEKAGGRAIAVKADVAKPKEVARLFATVDRTLGPVTALVNNAGIGGPLKRVDEHDEKSLSRLFATNTFGCFYCAAEAIRRMSRKQGGKGGAIVTISSAAARLGGLPKLVAYAASKGAVDSFTIGLAKEVGKEGIRVNAIRPGMIKTDILGPIGGDKLIAQIAPFVPLGRAGTPEEIGEAAIWLCSDAASYVHGAIIDVSGGR
ncbi:MAG: SDR family oxidoreductase [Proteobacteria bacterium]|nr:SDR family oxidoreductase [Pseudomonadota bacterium]MBI3498079.1 SDR family oxidoreductase [Pseudomonadota bacterium]